jgi:hypothetical protein
MRNIRFATPTAGKRTGTTAPGAAGRRQVIHDLSPISGTRCSRGNKESKVANVRQRTYCDVHLS